MFGQTMILYFMVGIATSLAMYVSGPERFWLVRLLQLVLAAVFWPLFLPLLLVREKNSALDIPRIPEPDDEMARLIAQVASELGAAEQSIDGDCFARSVVERLRVAVPEWRKQAQRIRDMDKALSGSDAGIFESITSHPIAVIDASHRSRQFNLQKLREIRDESYADLLARLAQAREEVSRLVLARFSM